jgi:hypothetical protein
MLFVIAMDYLLIQATSVPCECIFSSAKETDTAKWNYISPVLIEALQLLKFMLKKQCLNFMKGWAVPEEDMNEKSKWGCNLGTLFTDKSNTEIDNMLKGFRV